MLIMLANTLLRLDVAAILILCVAIALLPLFSPHFDFLSLSWPLSRPPAVDPAERPRSVVGWAGLLLKDRHVGVRQVGRELVSLRAVFAAWCLRAAAAVSPCQLEVLEAEPFPNFLDVGVERYGAELRLSIGDRAVQLGRSDVEHLCGLLSARWAGVVRSARAENSRRLG